MATLAQVKGRLAAETAEAYRNSPTRFFRGIISRVSTGMRRRVGR